MVQANVSLKRVNKFMNMEEVDPNAVIHDPNEREQSIINYQLRRKYTRIGTRSNHLVVCF